jgi:hypothetical protein
MSFFNLFCMPCMLLPMLNGCMLQDATAAALAEFETAASKQGSFPTSSTVYMRAQDGLSRDLAARAQQLQAAAAAVQKIQQAPEAALRKQRQEAEAARQQEQQLQEMQWP